MIQVKATCILCEGTGELLHNDNSNHNHNIPCPECEGEGTIILTSKNWDISIERVPPFSSEETEEMRKK